MLTVWCVTYEEWKEHCLVDLESGSEIKLKASEEENCFEIWVADVGTTERKWRVPCFDIEDEEWKLLVCRFGSDQLCLNRHWHCLQTETVSLAGLQNCSDQLCILHLKFEGWDCFVVECLYQHEWFEDFEHQSRSRVQKAKRRWGNVGTEQGRDGAEHRQARVGEELQSLVDYSTS